MKSPYKFSVLSLAMAAVMPLSMAGEDKAASILNATLDDLPDLPGFKVPPTGAYAVSIVSMLQKAVGEHPAVEGKFAIVEVLEVTETGIPDAELPVAGDEFNVVYMLDNDTGVGFLKEFMKPIAAALGKPTAPISELLVEGKGMTLSLVIKRTYDKEKDRHYLNIKKMEVL